MVVNMGRSLSSAKERPQDLKRFPAATDFHQTINP